MDEKDLRRVVFYSKDDMSWHYNLKYAEKLLKEIDLSKSFEINDYLEFYNIKLYFKNNLFLNEWSKIEKKENIEKTDKLLGLTKEFYLKIDNKNIIELVEKTDYKYTQTFWQLIDYYKIYKIINVNTFISILKKFKYHLTDILSSKNLVNHFDKELSKFLIEYNKTAELLLSEFEEDHIRKSKKYHFPQSLNLKDKEDIISKYLDLKDANLNYVNLIEKSKKTNQLKLTSKTKLKAKKKKAELNDKILEEGTTWTEGVQVAISKDQKEPAKFENNDNRLEVTYSELSLNERKDNIDLFHTFSETFAYTDEKGLITLISRIKEMDGLESVFMKSKNEYKKGSVFSRKSMLSHLQIILFKHYLEQRNLTIENLIETFLKEYLNPIFYNKLKFEFPNINSSYLEKIRVLAPEFEYLLKQYQTFVEEGNIDFELLEISSEPLYLSQIPSLVNKKYVYVKSDDIRILEYHFFSRNSMLYYIEPYKEKYKNFYTLLYKENVRLDQFEDYKKDTISRLIKDNYVKVNSDGFLKVSQKIKLYLIGELHKNEVINYWHYRKEFREEIDKMVNNGLLFVEKTLFTKQEISYLNYFLNKKEFTNGLDLRNKYLHGTNPSNEIEHENDYYILLKIIILVLLKIEDDIRVNIIKKRC